MLFITWSKIEITWLILHRLISFFLCFHIIKRWIFRYRLRRMRIHEMGRCCMWFTEGHMGMGGCELFAGSWYWICLVWILWAFWVKMWWFFLFESIHIIIDHIILCFSKNFIFIFSGLFK